MIQVNNTPGVVHDSCETLFAMRYEEHYEKEYEKDYENRENKCLMLSYLHVDKKVVRPDFFTSKPWVSPVGNRCRQKAQTLAPGPHGRELNAAEDTAHGTRS